MVYVVMGVSGCGKSTVGRDLARKLGVKFYDGDDFHPDENKAKMAALEEPNEAITVDIDQSPTEIIEAI